jgi:hypothetical protein
MSAPAWTRTGASEDPDPGAGLPARPHPDHEDPRGMVARNTFFLEELATFKPDPGFGCRRIGLLPSLKAHLSS